MELTAAAQRDPPLPNSWVEDGSTPEATNNDGMWTQEMKRTSSRTSG
jgi:hypothetical protein